jgi:hypothetical protein
MPSAETGDTIWANNWQFWDPESYLSSLSVVTGRIIHRTSELRFYRKIIFWWRVLLLWCMLSERVERVFHECHFSGFIFIVHWVISYYQTVFGSKHEIVNKSRTVNCIFLYWGSFRPSENISVARYSTTFIE